MAKVLVLYYSAYGHIETMAHVIAEGAPSHGVSRSRRPRVRPTGIAHRLRADTSRATAYLQRRAGGVHERSARAMSSVTAASAFAHDAARAS